MDKIIWSSDVNLSDWMEALREAFNEKWAFRDYEAFEDIPEEALLDEAYEINADYLECEKENLNVQTKNKIIGIARLGLWNGRPMAYKLFGYNIKNILESPYEPNWYFDGEDIRCNEVHHDGTNQILYRELSGNEDFNEVFLDKVYDQTATKEDIEFFTTSLSPYVKEVYGW